MLKPGDKPSHIALYLPSLRGGGAERVMVMLANGFASRGHKVDLVLASAEGPYLPEVSDAVRVVDLGKRRVAATLFPLIRYLKSEQPEAMLSALGHANVVALLARRWARSHVRLVLSEHNTPLKAASRGGVAAVLRILVRRLYPTADAIVCVSEGVRQGMQQMFDLPPDKLHCIYNPLDVDRIRRLMVEPVDHAWIAKPDVPVIVAVGRLTEQKDYPTLLRAFASLTRELPARLAILGEGEDEARLTALANELNISKSVAFLGFQKNPFAWLRACDLYVLSSRWEGLPGVLLEALACDARVVSTDCPSGPREILEAGKWGRLVPVGDPKALAEAMSQTLISTNEPLNSVRTEDFRCELAVDKYERLLLGI